MKLRAIALLVPALIIAWEASAIWRAIEVGAAALLPLFEFQKSEIERIAQMPTWIAAVSFSLIALMMAGFSFAAWSGWKLIRRLYNKAIK